jgi:pilus assembly protein CpaB
MNLSLRTIATLVVAIVAGLLAIFAVNQYVNSQKPAPTAQVAQAPQGAGTPVVVAASPIKRGFVLQPTALKVAPYPTGSVPDSAFSSVNQVTGDKSVQRVALRDIAPGEPILPTLVSAPGGHLNLAGLITPGMQAVAVRSNELAGVAGFVLPGDHVDVLLTRSIPGIEGRPGQSVTQILAQDVRVLGVDQSSDDQSDKPVVSRTITVEVTSSQAQSITLGQSIGTISMALRHVADPLRVARRGTLSRQFGYNPTPTRTEVVRIARGASIIEVPINPGGLGASITGPGVAVEQPPTPRTGGTWTYTRTTTPGAQP